MTNEQAKGYVIIAMKELGYPMKDIKKVIGEMKYWMDILSEEEAEERGDKLLINGD
jgi:hypothetical protein